MALSDTAYAAMEKKDTLLRKDWPRFSVRAILAGVYLTLGTAFAAVAGHTVESTAPGHGWGALVFASLFGLGLFSIVILNADLATGNMMYGSWGATTGQITWGRAIWFVFVTTVFNLVGAILVGIIIGVSGKFDGFDATHLMATLSEGKLDKEWWQVFIEGIGANFVVNMAVVGGIFAKDLASKFFTIVPIIAIFVGLGLEHVIANFSLFTAAGFAGGFDPALLPDNFTAGNIGINWLFAWLGNFVGGGILIGSVYAWLNMSKKTDLYKD